MAVDYAYPVEVNGGTPPFAFSAQVPANLAWLSIDPGTGVLGGSPKAVQLPGVGVIVHVTDANQQTATATLNLQVAFCSEGEIRACSSLGAGQCLSASTSARAVRSRGARWTGRPRATPTTAARAAPRAIARRRIAATGRARARRERLRRRDDVLLRRVRRHRRRRRELRRVRDGCTVAPAFGHPVCGAGTCGFACDDGYSRCGDACVKLGDDKLNCGTCGNVCPGFDPVCNGAQCFASCPNGTTNCNGACLAPSAFLADPASCGACGNVCPAPAGAHATCGGGSCGWACNAGTALCGGACVNVATDAANCGSCGHLCPADTTRENWFCSAGSCDYSCQAGYKWCYVTDTCILSGLVCREPIDPICGKYACKSTP